MAVVIYGSYRKIFRIYVWARAKPKHFGCLIVASNIVCTNVNINKINSSGNNNCTC